MPQTKFCPECYTTLSFREDAQKKTLLSVCPWCDYQEERTERCVYRRVYIEQDRVIQHEKFSELALDPTLPAAHGVPCPQCSVVDAVFFHRKLLDGEKELAPTFVCRACHAEWK